MQIRRPLAALLTALTLFGGGATLTGCEAAGEGQRDGTTDDSGNTGGSNPEDEQQGNVPDNSNQEPGSDQNQDTG
jgi:hypothetical protein